MGEGPNATQSPAKSSGVAHLVNMCFDRKQKTTKDNHQYVAGSGDAG